MVVGKAQLAAFLATGAALATGFATGAFATAAFETAAALAAEAALAVGRALGFAAVGLTGTAFATGLPFFAIFAGGISRGAGGTAARGGP